MLIQIKKKNNFKSEIKNFTDSVIRDFNLNNFINKIQKNYSKNLKDNNCNIDFGLPDYEDIFLEMMFKIGLNRETNNFSTY